MKKNDNDYKKQTFEIDKEVYKEFRLILLSSGKTVKDIINRLLKGFVDSCGKE